MTEEQTEIDVENIPKSVSKKLNDLANKMANFDGMIEYRIYNRFLVNLTIFARENPEKTPEELLGMLSSNAIPFAKENGFLYNDLIAIAIQAKIDSEEKKIPFSQRIISFIMKIQRIYYRSKKKCKIILRKNS